jgi:hypothetical protein
MDQARRGIIGTGIGFAALFVAGGLLLGEFFGGFADSDAFFVAHYADEGHHLRDLVGGHLFVASALALLLFLQLLTRHLRTLGGSDAGLEAARASGLVAVTLLLAGAAAVITVTMAKAFGRLTDDEPLTSSAVALAPQLGYALVFFAALWAVALAIGLIAWAGWRARLWPRGLRWLSVAAAVLLPLGWAGFMPIVLLPVWVLGVTIWAWRSSGDPLRTHLVGGRGPHTGRIDDGRAADERSGDQPR